MQEVSLGLIWPIADQKIITCPNCKSIFTIEGVTYPGSSKYQEIYCPVCGQKIIINTVRFLGFGRMWYPKKVLERNPTPPLPSKQPVKFTEEERRIKERRSKIISTCFTAILVTGAVVIGGLVLIKLLKD